MKASLFALFLAFSLYSCITTSPGNNTAQAVETSPESQAKTLTDKMKVALELDEVQTEKVLLINVVHFKILKKLRTSNENDKIASTKQKYREEIKAVLSDTQFQKFLVEFDV
jgi:hypothetical protein